MRIKASLVTIGLLVAAYLSAASLSPDVSAAATQGPAASGVAGHWTGSIEDGDYRMDIAVELKLSQNGWAGDAVVPEWGAYHWPLADIVVSHDRVTFRLEEVRGVTATFDGLIENDSLSGEYTWRGQQFHYSLRRGVADEPRQHPLMQLPTRPLPYDEQRVTFKSGQLILGGLLTVPHHEAPCPAVVFLDGSIATEAEPMVPGPPGREHYAFLVLADRLSRDGVVTLH